LRNDFKLKPDYRVTSPMPKRKIKKMISGAGIISMIMLLISLQIAASRYFREHPHNGVPIALEILKT